MNTFLADIRYALRMMRRSPLVTVIAVASLTLGVGANSAMFSLVDLLTFRQLPVKDAAKVLHIYTGAQSGGQSGLSYREFRDLQNETKAFSKIAALDELNLSYAEMGDGQENPASLTRSARWDWCSR